MTRLTRSASPTKKAATSSSKKAISEPAKKKPTPRKPRKKVLANEDFQSGVSSLHPGLMNTPVNPSMSGIYFPPPHPGLLAPGGTQDHNQNGLLPYPHPTQYGMPPYPPQPGMPPFPVQSGQAPPSTIHEHANQGPFNPGFPYHPYHPSYFGMGHPHAFPQNGVGMNTAQPMRHSTTASSGPKQTKGVGPSPPKAAYGVDPRLLDQVFQSTNSPPATGTAEGPVPDTPAVQTPNLEQAAMSDTPRISLPSSPSPDTQPLSASHDEETQADVAIQSPPLTPATKASQSQPQKTRRSRGPSRVAKDENGKRIHPSNKKPVYQNVIGVGQGEEPGIIMSRTLYFDDTLPKDQGAHYRSKIKDLITRAEALAHRSGCWLYLAAQHPGANLEFYHFTSQKLRAEHPEGVAALHDVASRVMISVTAIEKSDKGEIVKKLEVAEAAVADAAAVAEEATACAVAAENGLASMKKVLATLLPKDGSLIGMIPSEALLTMSPIAENDSLLEQQENFEVQQDDEEGEEDED